MINCFRRQNNKVLEYPEYRGWESLWKALASFWMLQRTWNLAARSSHFISPYSTASPPSWHRVGTLHDSSVEAFRQEAFIPSLPVVLPQGHFSEIPALRKWFHRSGNQLNTYALAQDYLSQFRDSVVPLELTRLPDGSVINDTESTFHRAEAPLGLFLEWTKHANARTADRLYLAQASFSVLPQGLRDDLPTPGIVAKAGKGDVYDTNLWMGVPPTYTPLHRDPNPNLFVQLAGKKTVRLLKPAAGHEVFASVQNALGQSGSSTFRGEEMMKGKEKRLLEAHVWGTKSPPEGAISSGYEACLERGDGLFIPQGWWHSIRGVGEGVTGSVSETGVLIFPARFTDGQILGQLVVPLMALDSLSLPEGPSAPHHLRQPYPSGGTLFVARLPALDPVAANTLSTRICRTSFSVA